MLADKHQILVVPGSGFGCGSIPSVCVKMEVVERSLKQQALADDWACKRNKQII